LATRAHSKSSPYVALAGAATTLILERNGDGAPLWRYWGPRLPDGVLPPAPLRAGRVIPSFSLDVDCPLSVMPSFGAGWFGESALRAHRDGRSFAQRWTGCDVRTSGDDAIEIELVDAVAAIRAILRWCLSPDSDVLTASTELINDGATPLSVDWLAAATLPLPPGPLRIRYWSGRHNREFVENEDDLSLSIWRRENRRGISSHDCFPGGLALTSSAGRHEGIVYALQFAWSGCHAQLIEPVDDGRRQWQFAERFAPGEARLPPGGSLRTPDVLATCSAKGANGVAINFHKEIRTRMNWPGGGMAPRKVHINSWEAFYFGHDESSLKAFADAAAALGVERFVLDDGWFLGRDSDRRGLGDWQVEPRIYPQGLAPLIAHVRKLGMEFGLWVEPEMANPDSDLLRAHPDWALSVSGQSSTTGRNQLVLDLTRREVGEHLFKAIDQLLRAYDIAYLKWDHNRDIALAGDAAGEPAFRRQVLAAYALMARLRAAHPHVEIEACAGGGGRIDAGIIQHTHRFWVSDCLDAAERLDIQRGFLQFFPPEIMGSHVGAAPSHATGRIQNLAFRAAVAVTGHFGLELNPATLADHERQTLTDWISFYKSTRDGLHGGETHIGACDDGVVWQAHGADDAYLTIIYRLAPTRSRQAPTLRLPMVSQRRRYRVTLAGPPTGVMLPTGEAFGALAFGEGLLIDGEWLATVGLPLPPMPAETALILRLDAAP
jgi:alpha-galactosidase